MASRKPLVINAGQIQQLQAGDVLDAAVNDVDIVSLTNNEVSAVVICSPVYADGADTFKKAKADAAGTRDVIGLVYTSPSIANGVSGYVQTTGIFVATTTQWDAVFGTTGGLAAGTKYYLSAATAGQATGTAPSTVGQSVVLIGIALSTTELKIMLNVGSNVLL